MGKRLAFLAIAVLLLAAAAHLEAQTTGSIAGRITDAETGQPLPESARQNMMLMLWAGGDDYPLFTLSRCSPGTHPPGCLDVKPDGTYQASPVPPGTYYADMIINFDLSTGYFPYWLDTWWPDAWNNAFWAGVETATPITVSPGQTVSSIDFRLRRCGRIRLHAQDQSGAPIIGAGNPPGPLGGDPRTGELWANYKGSLLVRDHWGFNPDPSQPGAYICAICQPPDATYTIWANLIGTDYVPLYYQRSPDLATAEWFGVVKDATIDKTMTLFKGGTISGAVAGAQLGRTVSFYRPDGSMVVAYTRTDPSGNYHSPGLPDGSYQVMFNPTKVWYRDVPDRASATLVAVHNGVDTPHIDFGLGGPPPASTFSVDPQQLAIAVSAGSASTGTVNLSITQGSAAASISSSVPWATASPASAVVWWGQTWLPVSVRFDATGVAPGTYTGFLTITDSAGAALPATVGLTMTVAAPPAAPPQLAASSPSLSFTSQVSLPPTAQTLALTNTGTADLAFSLEPSAAWFSAFPASGVLHPGEKTTTTVVASAPASAGSDRGMLHVHVIGAPDAVVQVMRNGTAAIAKGAWTSSAVSTVSLPAVATGLPGFQGSFWATDVFAMRVNPGAPPAPRTAVAPPPEPAEKQPARSPRPPAASTAAPSTALEVATMANEGAGGAAQAYVTSLDFPEQRPVLLSDVLASYLGRSSESNILQLRGAGASDLLVWGRTYSTQPDGSTFGHDIPNPGSDELLGPAGGTAYVPGLVGNTAFRTNLFITELAGVDTRVTVQAYGENGAPAGSPFSTIVKGFTTWKINRALSALGTGLARGTVTVTSDGGGQINAMATVIDNASNDPSTVMGKVRDRGDATSALYLTPVAHLAGLSGTQWRSDASLFNMSSDPVTVSLAYVPSSGTATGAPPQAVTIGPLQTVTLVDIVGSMFGVASGKGTIRIIGSAIPSLIVNARTYTLNPDGSTFGQGYGALRDSETLTGPQGTLYLTGLEESWRFRSAVGVVNVGDTTADISLTAVVGDRLERTLVVTLAPGKLLQLDHFLARSLGFSGDNANAVVRVRSLTAATRVLAYGSVVENRSQDPVFVRAMKR